MSQCERLGRKKISPYFSEKKWSLYGVACMITIHALGSYCTTAFFLRSMENVVNNWRSHHFWGHIACALFYVAVSLLPTPPKQSTIARKKVDPTGSCVSSYNQKNATSMGQHIKLNALESEDNTRQQQPYSLEMKYS